MPTTTGQSLAFAAFSERGYADTALGRLLMFLASFAGNGGSSGGASAALPNVLFVDGSYAGGSSTGSIIAPFVTIAEAMAAITQDDTSVMVLPGTYAENVVVPPARNGIAIKGLCNTNTRITGTGGAGTTSLLLAATSEDVASFELSDITVQAAPGTAAAVSISGAGVAPDHGALGSVLLSNVSIQSEGTSDLALTSVNAFRVNHCTINGSSTLITNSGAGRFRGCTIADLEVSYNADVGVLPGGGRGTIYLSGGSSVTGTLTLAQQCNVACDPGTRVANIASSSLSIGVLVAQAPRFEFHGQQGTPAVPGTCVISLPTALVTASRLNLDGAQFFTPSVQISSAGGAQAMSARSIKIPTGGVVALTGAGTPVLDMRGATGGATIPYTFTTAGTTIDRDRVTTGALTVEALATTFTLGVGFLAAEPPFPAGVNFVAVPVPVLPLTVIGDVPTVTASDSSSWTMGAQTNQTGVAFVLTRRSL